MALLLFGLFPVGHVSAASAQSDSQDPSERLGEFFHERNLFKQTGHQGADSRAGGSNTDERQNGLNDLANKFPYLVYDYSSDKNVKLE